MFSFVTDVVNRRGWIKSLRVCSANFIRVTYVLSDFVSDKRRSLWRHLYPHSLQDIYLHRLFTWKFNTDENFKIIPVIELLIVDFVIKYTFWKVRTEIPFPSPELF